MAIFDAHLDDHHTQAIRERDEAVAALHAIQRSIFELAVPYARRADISDSPLVEHARRELRLAGMFDKDADYGGALALQVVDLIALFASQGHSGESAMIALGLFGILARYETISPNDHSIRNDVSEAFGKPAGSVYQDARDSRYFSEDGGASWYSVDDRERAE